MLSIFRRYLKSVSVLLMLSYLGATLSAGNSISLQAGDRLILDGGVNMVSATVNAGGDINVVSSAGKITMNALYGNSSQVYRDGETTQVHQEIKGTATQLTSRGGGSIIMNAATGMDLVGLKTDTTGNVGLFTQTGDINLEGMVESTYNLYHREWNTRQDYWFFSITTHHVDHRENYVERADKTTLKGNNVVIKSGDKELGTQGDINKMGVEINATTIYESGKDKRELETNLGHFTDNNRSHSSSLSIGIIPGLLNRLFVITKPDDVFT